MQKLYFRFSFKGPPELHEVQPPDLDGPPGLEENLLPHQNSMLIVLKSRSPTNQHPGNSVAGLQTHPVVCNKDTTGKATLQVPFLPEQS